MLNESISQAQSVNHYDVNTYTTRGDAIATHSANILLKSTQRREVLNDSLKLLLLERDIREAEKSIKGHLSIALDAAYRDPSNLGQKIAKFNKFNAEVAANAGNIDALVSRGEALVAAGHFASHQIESQLAQLKNHWEELRSQVTNKGQKLNQASELHEYDLAVTEIEAWIDQTAGALSIKDLGNGLVGAQMLMKKFTLVETDIQAHKVTVDHLCTKAAQYEAEKYFDSLTASRRRDQMLNSYNALAAPAKLRREKLQASLDLQQFLLDVQDQLAWVSSKEPLVHSSDLGDSLSNVQIYMVRKKALESEMMSRSEAVEGVKRRGLALIAADHYASLNIQQQRTELSNRWEQLKIDADARAQKLKESYELQLYLADAREVDSFLSEKLPVATNEEYGDTEDSAKDLMKKHADFIADLKTYSETIDNLRRTSGFLMESGNFGSDSVIIRQRNIDQAYTALMSHAERRKNILLETYQLHQFNREVDSVSTWLIKCDDIATSTDIGTNKEDCEVLLKRFSDFSADVSTSADRVTAIHGLARKLISKRL